MKRALTWLGSVVFIFALLTACGDGGGSDSVEPTPDVDTSADKIVLTNGLLPGSYLLPGNETVITAYVTDSASQPVPDETVIYFSVSNTAVSISASAKTVNGLATATLQAGPASGNVTVTATTAVNIQTGTGVSSTIDVPIVSPPASIVVTNGLPPGTSLSPGETTPITAFVMDGANRPVVDGTTIFFSTTGFGASIDASATTVNGFATATFDSQTATGDLSVTAATAIDPQTGINITSTVSVRVLDNNAAAIKFISVSPESFIGIKGGGQNEFAEILFQVFNADGNPVADGTLINFQLTLSLHGGERLLEDRAFTSGGEVVARVQSGYVAGPLRVVASYVNEDSGVTVTTQGVVTVVSGAADLERLTISQTLFNQAGFLYEGLENRFNAILADRYGNIVKDGTPVSFISDCGRIGVNAPGVDELGSFELSTTSGVASAVFLTSNPVKPLCTIVAYTPGQESFDDLDANGEYDAGTDDCTADIGEPYIDEDLDGEYTPGEIYIDSNANGLYDIANGACDMDTLIWGSTQLTMSSYIGPLNLEFYDANTADWEEAPSILNMASGESVALRFDVEDIFGSRLVDGTVIEISSRPYDPLLAPSECFNLNVIGTARQELDDRSGQGGQISFILQDTTSANSTPQDCRMYLTIVSTDDTTTTGNNGSKVTTSFGVNYGLTTTTGDLTPPTVIRSVPADGATQVLADDEVTLVFSEPMDPLTVVPASITLTDLTLNAQRPTYFDAGASTTTSFTFTPDGGFTAGHNYRVSVSTAVEDLAGNNLANAYSFNFTSIGALVDPPRVDFTSPGQGAVEVRENASIVIEFSQPMDTTTVTTSNVFLSLTGGVDVPLTLTSSTPDLTTFVFDTAAALSAETSYTITVTANVRDASLIPMDKDFTSTFTTRRLP